MDKRILIVMLFAMILIVPTASALDFFPTHTFNNVSKTATIYSDFLHLQKVADIQLISNTYFCAEQCEAVIKISPNKEIIAKADGDYKFIFKDLTKTKDMNKRILSFETFKKVGTERVRSYEQTGEKCDWKTHQEGAKIWSCSPIYDYVDKEVDKWEKFDFSSETFNDKEAVYIKIKGKKLSHDSIDWMPIFYGQTITEMESWSGYSSTTDKTRYFKFNQAGTGTNAYEEVTAGNIAFNSAPTWRASSFGSGYNNETVGTRANQNVWIDTGIKLNVQTTGAITIEWRENVSRAAAGQNDYMIAGGWTGAGCGASDFGFAVDVYDNGDHDFSVCKADGTSNVVAGTDASATGRLVHWAVVLNASGCKIYQDGVKTDWNCATGIWTGDASEFLYLYNRPNNLNKAYGGSLDQVIVWSRELTPTEVLSANASTGDAVVPASIVSTLISPANSYNTTNPSVTFTCNATATATTISNTTLYVWNATGSGIVYQNTTDLSGTQNQTSWTYSLPVDNYYYWNCLARDTTTLSDWDTNRTMILDRTAPSINLTNVTNLQVYSLPVSSTIGFNSSDATAGVGSCWYYTSDSATNTTVTCNTNFNIAWATAGSKTIYAFTNDTLNNVNSTSRSLNVTYITYSYSHSPDSIGETDNIDFNLWVNSTNIPDVTAYLYLGGTVYSATKTEYQNYTYFTKNVVFGSGTGNTTGNQYDYYWNFTIADISVYNRSTQTDNVTVYNVSVTDCDLVSGRVILNMSLKDEELNSLVNITAPNTANIEIDLTITSLSNSSATWSFSKKWVSNNSVAVCIPNGLLNATSYKIDFTVGYDTSGHVREFFYMDNGTLDNTNYFNSYTDNTIDLLDLATADSTTFLFEYTDADSQLVDDIIVHTFRKYIGEGIYREVERSKQDDAGQTHVHLVEEDVIYYFMITQLGQILFTSDTYNAKCLSTPCQITLSASATEIDWDVIEDVGRYYSISTNKTTRIVTTTFSLDASSVVNATVYRFYNGVYQVVNSSTLTAMAGSIPNYIPLSYNNATFYIKVVSDGSLVRWEQISLTEDASDYFGTFGAILGGLIVVAMMLMAVSEGAGFIVFTILALIVIGIMQLVDLSWLALASIISAGAIIVWKLINRRGSRQ